MDKIIVIGPPRSGTTVITAFLNSHPEITPVSYEIFHPNPTPKNTGINDPPLDRFLLEHFGIDKYPSPENMEHLNLASLVNHVLKRYNGFKVLYGQVTRTSKVWSHIRSLPNIKIIRMWRQNLLEAALSMELARTSGVWNRTCQEEPPRDQQVSMPKHVLDHLMGANFVNNAYYADLFVGMPNVLSVEYEEVYDWDGVTGRIQDFLGTTRLSIPPVLLKRTRDKPAQIIKNYKMLKKYFHETLWGQFF